MMSSAIQLPPAGDTKQLNTNRNNVHIHSHGQMHHQQYGIESPPHGKHISIQIHVHSQPPYTGNHLSHTDALTDHQPCHYNVGRH